MSIAPRAFGEEFVSLTQNLFNDENAKEKAFKNTKDFYQAQLARADMHVKLLNVVPKTFLNQNSSRAVNLAEGSSMFDTSVVKSILSSTKSQSRLEEVREEESAVSKDTMSSSKNNKSNYEEFKRCSY